MWWEGEALGRIFTSQPIGGCVALHRKNNNRNRKGTRLQLLTAISVLLHFKRALRLSFTSHWVRRVILKVYKNQCEILALPAVFRRPKSLDAYYWPFWMFYPLLWMCVYKSLCCCGTRIDRWVGFPRPRACVSANKFGMSTVLTFFNSNSVNSDWKLSCTWAVRRRTLSATINAWYSGTFIHEELRAGSGASTRDEALWAHIVLAGTFQR